MQALKLILRHFRCYEDVEIPFTENVNLVCGKNGSGKTSLLEAFYLLSTGRSFLTSHLIDLIQNERPLFYIELHFIKDGVKQSLSIGFDGKNRHIHYNNTLSHNFTHLLGIFPSVLYSPKDDQLIAGAPQGRRRFLNIQIAQTNPLYVYHLVRYHKGLKQRNVLLKAKSQITIEQWEQMMSESAHYLIKQRSALVELLRPKIQLFAREISEQEDAFDLQYDPSIALNTPVAIQKLLAKQRPKDLISGNTMIGPHRDELQIIYKKKEAKNFASEGQKRTCIAALKMAEWEILKQQTATAPLLAIDDFGTHLDPKRTEILQGKLQHFGQVILTSPLFSQANLHIHAGTLLPAN